MRAKWEYASVVWTNTTRKVTKSDAEFVRLDAETKVKAANLGLDWAWWYEQKFDIWLPGATEPDIRLAWETGEEGYKASFLDIFNEMGADGWELVSQTVRNNAMGRSQGFETASFPIRIYTVFKRPAAE